MFWAILRLQSYDIKLETSKSNYNITAIEPEIKFGKFTAFL